MATFGPEGPEQKDYSSSHRKLHDVRNEMIKAIHGFKGDKSVVPSERAEKLLTEHSENALPHAKEFIKAWHASHGTEQKPEADPAAPEAKVLKLKPQARKKVLRVKPKQAPVITLEVIRGLIADAVKANAEALRAELRKLSGKVT